MTTGFGGKSPAQTTSIVIFGASGDLTRRKLILSRCSLFSKGRLGPEVQIVGVARSNLSVQEFRDSLIKGMEAFEGFPRARENGRNSHPVSTIAVATSLLPANPPTGCTTWRWRRSSAARRS